MTEPTLIIGNCFVDDRGEVKFVNDFNFEGVKRFYQVSNHKQGFRRAWHGHMHEAKYVYVVKGAAMICAVPLANQQNDLTGLKKFILSDKLPKVLYIPKGYYNGFMTLSDDTQLMFFSTSTVEESLKDDIRQEVEYFRVWQITER